MKFTITGSLGNISRPLAETLIQGGHQVTIISSNPGKTGEIESLGAKAALGPVQDLEFLTETFRGADAVYTMVPPNFAAKNYVNYVEETGNIYATAINVAGVRRVVNLSSIGAHLDSGTGPVAGLHLVEIALNKLQHVAVTHLRPGFFYTNFFNDIPLIKEANLLGSNYPASASMVLVHPVDIAAVAAEELQLPGSGHTTRYIVSDERTPQEVAATIGKAIQKPGLTWTEFTDEQVKDGMLKAGLPPEIASTYTELGTAVRRGIIWEHYRANRNGHTGRIKLEDFARVFAERYAA